MSDHSTRETERPTQETSSLAAGFLTLAFVLVILGGGVGVWKYYAKNLDEKASALEAEREAIEAKLKAYKVDPETGKLSDAGGSIGRAQTNPEYAPNVGDFELIDRSGRKITNKDLLGQPYAVSFIFTKCFGPCLGITGQMAKLQKELGDAPVRLVTITVDPKYDTPEVLKNYAENFGAQANRWFFLTGEPDYVYKVLRENYRQFVREETGEARQRGFEVAHEAGVLHIDAKGRIVKRYLGSSDAEMMQLRMALLDEAERLAKSPEQESAKEDRPAVAEKPETGSEGGE